MSHHGGNYNESPVKSEVIGNGTVSIAANSRLKLRVNPNKDHKPEGYDDLDLDFSPSIFSSLERHLPTNLLVIPRDDKAKFMREILLKYLPSGERHRVWFQFSILNFSICLVLFNFKCLCFQFSIFNSVSLWKKMKLDKVKLKYINYREKRR
jgi:hypothetical protein